MYVLPVQYALDQMSTDLAANAESLMEVLGHCDGSDLERKHLVPGLKRLMACPSLLLYYSQADAKVYEPSIRALFGTTAYFCEAVVLTSRLMTCAGGDVCPAGAVRAGSDVERACFQLPITAPLKNLCIKFLNHRLGRKPLVPIS